MKSIVKCCARLQVSFSNIPYSEVITRAAHQERLVTRILTVSGALALAGATYFAVKKFHISLDTFKIDIKFSHK
jgi:hypothetical protein